VLRVDDTVGIRVSLLASEACTGKEGKSDTNVSHIKQSLLQSAVPTTPEVPCCPVGGAILLLSTIKDSLGKSLPSKVILLLTKMERDVCNGRGDAKGLMESSLDRHGAEASTEATTVLLLSPLLEWIKCKDEAVPLLLEKGMTPGRMTDCCSTQSTRKGMGLVEKKGEFLRKIIHHHGDVRVVCNQFEAVSGAVKVCEFHV